MTEFADEPRPDAARQRSPAAIPGSPWFWLFLGFLCLATAAGYLAIAGPRESELGTSDAADAYYNLQVRGFLRGQLSLDREAPAGLAALADPYDPAQSAPFRLGAFDQPGRVHDLTYFRGKLHLYFGVTPALLLFLPWRLLTGSFLDHQTAVAVFATGGFLATVGLFVAMWRRYFPAVPAWLVLSVSAGLGWATGVPILLQRPDVWEVPIMAGYALVMLALNGIWRAVHADRGGWRPLALASLAYGLAVGARPSLLPGAVILLAPWFCTWLEQRRAPGCRPGSARLLLAALAPIAGIGLCLMLYNQARFGSVLEFGQHYQLAGDRQDRSHFSPAYLWFNGRVYFLHALAWRGGFPFLQNTPLPALPEGHGTVELPVGLLVGMPFIALGLALPLAWRQSAPLAAWRIRTVALSVLAVALPTALVLCLFYGSALRYEVEFAPYFILLAALGVLGLDTALAARPGLRIATRLAVVGMLAYSILFNVLASAKNQAELDYIRASNFLDYNRPDDAVPILERVLARRPGMGEVRLKLALALAGSGRPAGASAQIDLALTERPDLALVYADAFAADFARLRHYEGAMALLRGALKLSPQSPALHNNLAATLVALGNLPEGLAEYQEALRLDPNNPRYLVGLGTTLARANRRAEARQVLSRALELDPGAPGARAVLQQLGNAP